MSLKINGIGKPVTNFTHIIGQIDSNAIELKVTFQHNNTTKTKKYEIQTDTSHPNITLIISQLNVDFNLAQSKKVEIRVDKVRNYIDINGIRYTGIEI